MDNRRERMVPFATIGTRRRLNDWGRSARTVAQRFVPKISKNDRRNERAGVMLRIKRVFQARNKLLDRKVRKFEVKAVDPKMSDVKPNAMRVLLRDRRDRKVRTPVGAASTLWPT